MDLPPPPSSQPPSSQPPFAQPPPPSSQPPFGQAPGFGQPPRYGGSLPGYAMPPSVPRASSRSGMAVAALVCGLVGLPLFFIAVPSILGIVFGFVAASAIRSSGGRLRGAGLAKAGWILGIIGLLGFVGFVVAAATGRLDGDDAGAPGSMAVGTCVADLPVGSLVDDLEVVDCATPHQAEVFAVIKLNPDGDIPYPGEEAAEEQAANACYDAFEAYVGEPYDTSVFEIYYIYSQRLGWKATRGNVDCLVFEPGKRLTGSVQGSGR